MPGNNSSAVFNIGKFFLELSAASSALGDMSSSDEGSSDESGDNSSEQNSEGSSEGGSEGDEDSDDWLTEDEEGGE